MYFRYKLTYFKAHAQFRTPGTPVLMRCRSCSSFKPSFEIQLLCGLTQSLYGQAAKECHLAAGPPERVLSCVLNALPPHPGLESLLMINQLCFGVRLINYGRI